MSSQNDDTVDPKELDESSENATPASETESTPAVADGLAAFDDAALPKPLRKALQEKGYNSLTSVQESVALADTFARDLRISSQTGSGKTVAVGIALGRYIEKTGPRRNRQVEGDYDPRAPEVLVLTPTRELAMQVKRELGWLFSSLEDAYVEVVTGGTSVGMERKNLARGPRVVVATPGRALDHLSNNAFSGAYVTHVVLDEADQMLDLGFRDELQAIMEQCPNRTRTHLVSATFSGEVLRIAERYQKDPIRVEGTALGAANQDIEHIAHVVSLRHRYDALVNLLLKHKASVENEEDSRILVFTRTRADTIEIAERLQRDGISAEPLSGDLAQAQRTRTLSAFRSGRVQTLVATDVAARGIDVKGIDLVIHLDPPGDPDTFTHRSGRTGRAGQKGTSVLLLPPQARGRMERLFHVAKVKPTWAPIPTADKIKKLYAKLTKRKLYAALETPPDASYLEYAQKIVTEHPAEAVIAQLLSMVEVEPPCLPRDISEHFAAESRGARRKPEGPRRGRFDGDARRGRFDGPRGFDQDRRDPRFDGPSRFDGPRPDTFDDRGPRRPKFRGPAAEGGRSFRGPRPEGENFEERERFDGPRPAKFRGPPTDGGRPFRGPPKEGEPRHKSPGVAAAPPAKAGRPPFKKAGPPKKTKRFR